MKRFMKFCLFSAGGLVALLWVIVLAAQSEQKGGSPDLTAMNSDIEAPVMVAESVKSEPSPAKEPINIPPPKSVAQMDESDRMIAFAINKSGNLCARPIEVREAGGGLYGVRCITNRNGTGISDYLVNARTNEVIPI